MQITDFELATFDIHEATDTCVSTVRTTVDGLCFVLKCEVFLDGDRCPEAIGKLIKSDAIRQVRRMPELRNTKKPRAPSFASHYSKQTLYRGYAA